ncbi:MAG: acyl-CoA-binding protein [Bacillariaceae sp.]|jgi:acyl-CoA-binding protein
MKSTSSSVFVVATMTVVAVAAATIFTGRALRRRRRRRDNDDDNNKGNKDENGNVTLKDGSQESLVNERFQACVVVMGSQLKRLPQQTQLDYYGLYKQGTLGDCTDYQSSPPPAYDLVATAKYRAWYNRKGMDRITAMQNYIDKAIHYQFIKNIAEGDDDEDYELEGDAAIDMMGMGDKPSTLAGDYDKEQKDELALEDSQYPLHAAAREGRTEELKKILLDTSSTISPNALDVSGQTPLHLATDRGHIECVKALVLEGANINSVDHDGISILQAAVIGGNKECCQLLLILGANPDQADHDGDTPRDSSKDDKEMKELFDSYDTNALSKEKLLDPMFIKELQNRNIPCFPETSKTTSASTNDGNKKKEEKVGIKQEMKVLDEAIDFELDDDGDIF